MEKTCDIAVSGFLLVAGIALLSSTFGEAFDVRTFGGDVGPAFAPRLFLVVWIVLALLACLSAIRRANGTETDIRFGQLLGAILVATATAFAMTKIGFLLAMIPGIVLFCIAFGYRRIVPLVVVGIATPVVVWATFTFGFELLLPRSPWFHQF